MQNKINENFISLCMFIFGLLLCIQIAIIIFYSEICPQLVFNFFSLWTLLYRNIQSLPEGFALFLTLEKYILYWAHNWCYIFISHSTYVPREHFHAANRHIIYARGGCWGFEQYSKKVQSHISQCHYAKQRKNESQSLQQ